MQEAKEQAKSERRTRLIPAEKLVAGLDVVNPGTGTWAKAVKVERVKRWISVVTDTEGITGFFAEPGQQILCRKPV